MTPKNAMILLGKILGLLVWLCLSVIVLSACLSYGGEHGTYIIVASLFNFAGNCALLGYFYTKWKM